MANGIVPRADNEGSIGTAAKRWANIFVKLINGAFPVTQQTAGLTSDVNRSLTSLGNVTGLDAFTLRAGHTYHFLFKCLVTTNATSVGIKLSVNFSGGSGQVSALSWLSKTPTSASAFNSERVTTLDGGTVETTGPGATVREHILEGIITVTANGTLALRQASETATQTTVKAGSFGLVREIA